MDKIFSYSLFEPKQLPSHRVWDSWRDNKERYWFNIPTIIILNKLLYPEYNTLFFVSPNVWDNPLSKIFECFENDIKVETITREYSYTEPAIWRMIPLWDRETEILHPRDVDSLPTEMEYKYIQEFENSSCLIGTIRSHENHFGIACRMLAGLSSFKPNKISPAIKGFNFDFYYSRRLDKYGSDQDLLIQTFTENSNFTDKYFLDCKINKQQNKQDFPCVQANLAKISIEEEKQKIFHKINEYTSISWLGEPCDSRGDLLNYLLDLQNKYKDKIIKNDIIRKFYKCDI